MSSKRREDPGRRAVRRGLPQRPASRTRTWLLLAGGTAFVLGIVAYGILSTGSPGGDPKPGRVSAEVAPDVVLAVADGEFRLSEHRGKVVVLYFSFPG